MKQFYLKSWPKRHSLLKSFCLLSLGLLFIVSSCKKSGSDNAKPNPTTTSGNLPVRVHQSGDPASSDLTITYVNGNMLSKYDEGTDDDVTIQFTYTTDKKPLTIDIVNDEGENKATFSTNPAGQITRADITIGVNSIGYTYALYTYNSSNLVSSIKYFDAKNNSQGVLTLQYDGSGNVTSSVLTGDNGDSETYAYDTKNGIFKNVAYMEMFMVFGTADFSAYNVNNAVKITDNIDDSFNQTISYIYNSDNYPSQITDAYNDGSPNDVSTVTYSSAK